MQLINKINLAEEFHLIDEYWSPRIAGELNDSYLKLARRVLENSRSIVRNAWLTPTKAMSRFQLAPLRKRRPI